MPLERQDEALRVILRSAGIKITPVRLEVLDLLLKAGQPQSHSEVQSVLTLLDRVTIYRTLSSFVDSGIAHQVQGLDGMWRFCAHDPESSGCPGNHPHFLCTSCGRMICLLDQSMPRVDIPDGYAVHGKQFVVYGLCPDCGDKSARPVLKKKNGDENL
jgi:Fur family ferric uptake transcriptional regulator/Fur family zinc uptake transcriptional regulator